MPSSSSDEARTPSRQTFVASRQWWLLTLLTASYVVGELSHFLIGVTSRDVARTIHYGDVACFKNMTFERDDRTTADDDEEVSCSSRRNISRSHSRNLSINPLQNLWHGSRSPGLVVMGDESYSRGHGFKSQRYILDGHDIFSHWFVVKLYCLFKKLKINKKEARVVPPKNLFMELFSRAQL